MPKTYEQECLEIESARISADLAYQREKNVVYNKPLFSKKEMDDLIKKYNLYMFIEAVVIMFGGFFVIYILK